MRKFLVVLLAFMSIAAFKDAWCEDNLLAVDVIVDKQKSGGKADKILSQDENINSVQPAEEEQKPVEDPEQDIENIRAYHELFNNKQRELEIIRLDLEKSNLLLKKKEAEKEFYQIENALPKGKKEEFPGPFQGLKNPLIDSADIKIQLLLISDSVKEGQISIKGSTYSFREGDVVASNLTVEKIDSFGVALRQENGNILKLNFVN